MKRSPRLAVLIAILLVFFFQLLSDFIESIYAFGLLNTSLTAEVGAVLLLLSPLLLLLFRRRMPRLLWLAAGQLSLLCRVSEPLMATRGRMITAGFGVGLLLIYLPGLLAALQDPAEDEPQRPMGAALVLALLLGVLFRVIGSGFDITTYGAGQVVGVLLALVAAWLMPGVRFVADGEAPGPAAGRRRTLAAGLGFFGVLTLVYFFLWAPNVIARWSGAGYLTIVSLLVVALIAYLQARRRGWLAKLSFRLLLGWNALFVAALVLTIAAHQFPFPAAVAGYPFFEPAAPFWSGAALVLMLVLSPVLILDFELYCGALAGASPRRLAGGFGAGSFFLLLMIFSHIFTTVYDYIPVVGPFFRDKFWQVHLAAALAATLPLFALRNAGMQSDHHTHAGAARPMLLRGAGLLGAACIILLAVKMPRPVLPAAGPLRVVTYNVQQGYSELGVKNFRGQLDLLAELAPDIIGLQESDTNRIAGGNADLVRYFAEQLGMYSYYGPKSASGTFGIALLSRYPIAEPRTFFMYSQGEQTAAITARIEAHGRSYQVVVIHLGNGGPLVQQQGLLEVLAGQSNVILMGDFNFRPDSEQYALTTSSFLDAWLLRWPQGVDDQGNQPDRRIDHFFVSAGIEALDVRYIESQASDHPLVFAQLR